MPYDIRDKTAELDYNHDGELYTPTGIVIHSTATPEATDENEFIYFDACNRDSSAHYFADYDSITRFIKENEVAWHAGYTANHKFIGIELCEFADPNKFQEVWNRGVWLAADICRRYGFGVDRIFSHHQTSTMYHETNHTDPDGYFAAHGRNFDQFKAEVQSMLNASNAPIPPAKPLFKLLNGGSQVGAYSIESNAYKEGWRQFNELSRKDIILITPEGDKYTFALHPEANPVQPEPEPAPTPAPGVPKNPIFGKSQASLKQIIGFARQFNPDIDINILGAIAVAFLGAGEVYGIRGDVAFAQSCLETGYFRFINGTAVTLDQNNFCGLGVHNTGDKGFSFPTIYEGVIAQMQHLYAYATKNPLPAGEAVIDPKYVTITKLPDRFGMAPNWEDLNMKWAMNDHYGQAIMDIHRKMLAFVPVEEPKPTPAPVPEPPKEQPKPEEPKPQEPVQEVTEAQAVSFLTFLLNIIKLILSKFKGGK